MKVSGCTVAVKTTITKNGNTHINGLPKWAPRQAAVRTGELVFNVLWSYVREDFRLKIHIAAIADMGCLAFRLGCGIKTGREASYHIISSAFIPYPVLVR